MMDSTHTRNVTPDQVADIITDTITATDKDLQRWGSLLKQVAELAIQVCMALQRDEHTTIEPVTTRTLRFDSLVDACLSKLTITSQTSTLTYDEICYCMALYAPDTLQADFTDTPIAPVLDALMDKGVLSDATTFAPRGERFFPMFDCFLGLLDCGGTLPESLCLEISGESEKRQPSVMNMDG